MYTQGGNAVVFDIATILGDSCDPDGQFAGRAGRERLEVELFVRLQ
jgi:hypothetical protein